MGLIYRTSSIANAGTSSIKNAELTYQEGDGNIAYLLTNLSGSNTIQGTTTISGPVQINDTVQMDGAVFMPQLTSASQNSIVTFDSASGRFYYTASSAIIPTTIQFADTASFVTASNVYGPFGSNSVLSSSFAVSASWAPSTPIDTSSFITTGSSTAVQSITGSLRLTGSLFLTGSATVKAPYVNDTLDHNLALGTLTINMSQLSGSTGNRILPGGYDAYYIGLDESDSGNTKIKLWPTVKIDGGFVDISPQWTGPITIIARASLGYDGWVVPDAFTTIEGAPSQSLARGEFMRLCYDSSAGFGNWRIIERGKINTRTITSSDTGSLLTTASVSLNTITFTKGDGSTFPITVNTGSGGGGGGLTGGTQYYVPVWTGATTLGTSSLYESGSVLKTVSGGIDIGLKLDFANGEYNLGYTDGFNRDGVYINLNTGDFAFGAIDSGSLTYLLVSDGGGNKSIKTSHSGSDIGLNLDFANDSYYIGNYNSNALSLTSGIFTGISTTINGISQGLELVDGGYTIYSSQTFQNGIYFAILDPNKTIKTGWQGNDRGLRIDFASSSYSLGDFDNVSGSTKLIIDDNARRITISGSTILSGSLFVNNLTTGSTSNVLTYNTTTGQVFFTASSAVGGGGSPIDTSAFLTTGSLSTTQQLSGSLNITGSLNFFSGSTNATTIENGWVILSQVSMSLNFANDAAAAAGGVPLGGLYRNGNAISIRIA